MKHNGQHRQKQKTAKGKLWLVGTALAVSLTSQAHAGATFDPFSYANAISTVSNTAEITSQMVTTLETLKEDLNISKKIYEATGEVGSMIPDINGGTAGQFIQTLNLGMSAYGSAKNTVENMVSQIESMSNIAMSLQNDFSLSHMNRELLQNLPSLESSFGLNTGELNQFNNGSMTIQNAAAVIGNNFFAQTATPSSEQVQGVTIMRLLTQQQHDTTALVTAAGVASSETQTSQTSLANLAGGSAKAKDLRGDIKANSAAQLSWLSEIEGENQMLSSLIRIMISRTNVRLPQQGATFTSSITEKP